MSDGVLFDPNTTLTCREAVVRDDAGPRPSGGNSTDDGKEEGGGKVEEGDDTGDNDSPEKDTLSPGLLSTGEESESITPTTSFCRDRSSYVFTTDVSEKHTEGDGSENVGQKGGSDRGLSSTPLKDTQQQSGEQKDSQSFSNTAPCDGKDNHSLSEQKLDPAVSKSAATKNGMHTFYIGDEGEEDLRKILSNGSLSHDADTRKKLGKQEHVSDSTQNKGKVRTHDGKTVEEHADEEQGDHAKNDAGTDQSARQDSPDSEKSASKADRLQRQTSESGVDVGSSDGSVIMQLWGAFSLRSRQSSQDSKTPSRTSQQSTSDSTVKKPTLKASIGSSFTSSIDSKQSDEVFQDASDDFDLSTEEGTSTAATTALEESQYETGIVDSGELCVWGRI